MWRQEVRGCVGEGVRGCCDDDDDDDGYVATGGEGVCGRGRR